MSDSDGGTQSPPLHSELEFAEPSKATTSSLSTWDVQFYLNNSAPYAEIEQLMISYCAYLDMLWSSYRYLGNAWGDSAITQEMLERITKFFFGPEYFEKDKINGFITLLTEHIQNGGDIRLRTALSSLEMFTRYIKTHHVIQYADMQNTQRQLNQVALKLQEFRLEATSVLGASWLGLHKAD